MSRSKSRQVVIVGAGLFGSVAAKLCRLNGFEVTIIDAGYVGAGSKPAACLIAPSWISGLGDKAKIGVEVLNGLYTVKDIPFSMNNLKDMIVHHIKPNSILKTPTGVLKVVDDIVHVGDGFVEGKGGDIYKGYILVAAGVWCDRLIELPNLQSIMGSAQYYKAVTPPAIHIWAPYKQAVAFNITPSVTWFGDGTSILKKNFGEQRVKDSTARAKKYFKLTNPDKIIIGQRPYVKGHKGYFEQVYEKTWVSTGGAKNGTVLAAYQAQMFLEAIL